MTNTYRDDFMEFLKSNLISAVKCKYASWIIILAVVFLIFIPTHSSAQQGTTGENFVYLPLLTNRYYNGYTTDQKFLGIYMQVYWTYDPTDPNNPQKNTVPIYMPQADSLAGKKHSVSGWFISLEDIAFTNQQPDIRTNNFYRQLEALWQNGYVSLVNLNTKSTSKDIAYGKQDDAIEHMADLYKQWVSKGDGRIAFIAPLPEMNGVDSNGNPWTSYGGDPINFKLAYQHIQNIFQQNGVGNEEVWWVFAPNGWSRSGHEFEKYYPGDNLVDVNGFSSYNFGFCRVAIPWQRWENYDTLYTPYISRLQAMSPNKPIIITQTGTTAEFDRTGVVNVEAKNNWLRDNYQYFTQEVQVLGIMYYDFDQSAWECNWRILPSNTYQAGYSIGVSSTTFQYLTAQNLKTLIP